MAKIDTPVTIVVALSGKLRNAHMRTLRTLEQWTSIADYRLRIGGVGVSPEVRAHIETMHNIDTCLLCAEDDPTMTEDRLMRLLAHQPPVETTWIAFVYGGTYFSGDWLTEAKKALIRSRKSLGILGRVESADCGKIDKEKLSGFPWFSESCRFARVVKTCRPGFTLLPADTKLVFDWPVKRDEALAQQEVILGLAARHTENAITEIGPSVVVGQVPVPKVQLIGQVK